eukprot:3522633-Rhodomonas_salina.1
MVTNTSAKRLSSYQAVTFCFKQNKSPVLNDPCNCMGNCVRKTEAANPAGAMSSPADKPDDADLQEASELIGSLDAALGNAAGPATAEPPSVLLRVSACLVLFERVVSARYLVPPMSPNPRRSLNPELFVAAQIDESSFKEIKAFGIKSVFNLRLPGEAGNEDFEPRFKEEGITLTNYPMDFDTSTWSDALLDKLLTSIDAAQPPTLVYCGIAMRAAMIGMAHTATRSRFNQGKLRDELDPEAFLNQHNSILDGFKNHSKTPSMREYVKAYMATKVRNMLGRPGFAQLREDIF